MIADDVLSSKPLRKPIDLAGRDFALNKNAYYAILRQEAPVTQVKLSLYRPYAVSRYEDCVALFKDPRFVRNRNTATGKGRFPVPMPHSINLLMENMLTSDGDAHRRLRHLVHSAFTPKRLQKLEARIESLTHELLDVALGQGTVDLKRVYALPIPVTVISEMVGADGDEVDEFQQGMQRVMQGSNGWRLLPVLFWHLPRLVRLVRRMIDLKRRKPGDDILSGLILAEAEGDRLTQDELVAMVFLLISAGYETTVNLITNGVLTLLQHPDQMALLRNDLELMESAVEEILRFSGPVHSSEIQYAAEDVVLHDVEISRGASAITLIGAANRDPAAFAEPEIFDITRSPNRHLGFGQGIHYCLGAPLARIETRIALTHLLERAPNLSLAVPAEKLRPARVAGFHSYRELPIKLI